MTARTAQSSPGLGLVRRSAATSCRSTSSSASLDADERPSRTSQPQSSAHGGSARAGRLPEWRSGQGSGRELMPGFIKLVRSPLTLLISVRSFRFGRVSPPLRREENRDRAGAYRPPGSLIYRLVLPVQGLALVW
jgi:hypothetical protein